MGVAEKGGNENRREERGGRENGAQGERGGEIWVRSLGHCRQEEGAKQLCPRDDEGTNEGQAKEGSGKGYTERLNVWKRESSQSYNWGKNEESCGEKDVNRTQQKGEAENIWIATKKKKKKKNTSISWIV